MSETTAADRRAQLQAELEAIEAQEAAEADARRREVEAQRRAELEPELQAEAARWEQQADEALEREYPGPWRPHKDAAQPKQIVGKVLRINPMVGPSDFGTYSAAVEVVTTQLDEWTVWMPHSGTMYAEIVRQRLQPGEMIAIRYRGKKDSQRTPGQSYHDYRLVVLDRPDGGGEYVDYDQLAREHDQPQLPPAPSATPDAEPDDDIPF